MSRRNAKYGWLTVGVRRDLSEKGWVPLRFWVLWGVGMGVALVLFYVLLTPIWMGLRVMAWLSDRRPGRRR
jgi:hypothetical protein